MRPSVPPSYVERNFGHEGRTDSEVRRLPAPATHRIEAPGGWTLVVKDFAPDGGRAPLGTVVAGHGMMVDGRTLCRAKRPSLTATLVAAGFRVLVPDLRGHGASRHPIAGSRADWDLDDLAADVGRYIDLARTLEPRAPVVLVGHSLFGHAALAWLGQQPDAQVCAAVALSWMVWNRRLLPSVWRWAALRLMLDTTVPLANAVGYIPARRLGFGTDDASKGFWRQFAVWVRTDRWTSTDGRVDYGARLEDVRCPVLHMVSTGDVTTPPTAAAGLSQSIPNHELIVLGQSQAPDGLDRLSPDHMGMVMDPKSEPAWDWVAKWLKAQIDAAPVG